MSKELDKFKQEFDEVIMTIDARLDVLEAKINDIGKLMREVQTGVRRVDQKSEMDWSGLRGTIGDLQKKISELAEPIKNINRNNRGYKK
jgi:prefoldin subunit 5